MKANINRIKEAIKANFKNAKIQHYYVSDEGEIYQVIGIYGEIEYLYFWITIIGKETSIREIVEKVNLTDNKYMALYRFNEKI